MKFVARGGKGSRVCAKCAIESRALRIFRSHVIDLLVVIWISKMNLIGRNSDNGPCSKTPEIGKMSRLAAELGRRTILPMQFFNLCVISAATSIIEEEGVEIRHSREGRAWDFGKRVEIASIHEDAQERDDCCCGKAAGGERTSDHCLSDTKEAILHV